MKPAHILIGAGLLIAVLLFRKPITRTVMSALDEQLTKNFTLGELIRTDTGLINEPNAQEKANLKRLAEKVLQPWRDLIASPLAVNSAFRSDAVNRKVGGVANSQHRTGDAADVRTPKMDLWQAYKKLVTSTIPYDQAIIEEKNGRYWIHVSYSNVPRRQALVAKYDAGSGSMIYSPYVV